MILVLRKKVTLTQAEGESPPRGFVYVGEAVDGATLLAEDNLPEVVCARLGAPELKERGVGEAHTYQVFTYRICSNNPVFQACACVVVVISSLRLYIY